MKRAIVISMLCPLLLSAADQAKKKTTSRPAQPYVVQVQGANKKAYGTVRTQVFSTNAKGSSLSALAGNRVVHDTVRAGLYETASRVQIKTGSSTAYSGVVSAGQLLAGLIAKGRKQNLSYVWALCNATISTLAQARPQKFKLMFGDVPGSQPGDFNIAMVKLASGPLGCELVGAAESPQRVPSDASKSWDLYSKFIEDQVPVTAEMQGTGQILFSVPEGLAAGDYAIVLRPAVKTKTFSSAEIVSSAGDGLLFNSLWVFRIP